MVEVSVVVPARNAAGTIGKCITSLLRQESKNPYEILVVDNGSTDSTAAIAKSFGKKISVISEKEMGSYKARNKGISKARGKIIAFTDSDCIANQNWLANIIKSLKEPGILVVGGRIQAYKPRGLIQEYCARFEHDQETYIYSVHPFCATANMAARKKELKKIGYFDQKLLSGGDYDLCKRLLTNPKQIAYAPDATVHHIYKNSIGNLVHKHYTYGKGCKALILNKKTHPRLVLPTYWQLLLHEKPMYLLLRLVQDTSYKLGLLLG
ncbi:MAG: glycosyltransferase [Candidatus Woesearchaeota archaeon]